MRRALILLALAPFLLAQAGLPRARCDFGAGVAALREAGRDAARPVAELLEGRARAEAMAGQLRGAVVVFLGCGCDRLAERTAEAAGLAAGLALAPDTRRLADGLAQTRLRVEFAERAMARDGCR